MVSFREHWKNGVETICTHKLLENFLINYTESASNTELNSKTEIVFILNVFQ